MDDPDGSRKDLHGSLGGPGRSGGRGAGGPQAPVYGRAVARAVGVSPSTVGAVRRRSRVATAGQPAQDEPLASVERMETNGGSGPTRPYLPTDDFIQWFDGTEMGLEEVDAHLPAVPLSRVYEIADQARRRARLWDAFADTVEPRSERLT